MTEAIGPIAGDNGPEQAVSADSVSAPKVPLYRRPGVWMTGLFFGVIGVMGIWGVRNGQLHERIAQLRDPSSNVIDTANLYRNSQNQKPKEIVFFYAPPNAKNSTAMMSNGAYFYVDDKGLLHFGAVRGDAKITGDWQQFEQFKKSVGADRGSDDPEKKLHKYQGMMYVAPAAANLVGQGFAACDLQFFCMGDKVQGFQAAQFAADHVRRLQSFQDAAKTGDLVAFIVPLGDANESRPFDISFATRVTGRDAELQLAQVTRVFSEIAIGAASKPQNHLLSAQTVESLPTDNRGYWIDLYSYARARDTSVNLVLPNRNYAGGRKVTAYTPMMIMEADKAGNLTITEFGFENRIEQPPGNVLYAEPYAKVYQRPTAVTEEEKASGITIGFRSLAEAGWIEKSVWHGDDAIKFITDKRDGISRLALDTSTAPEIPQRTIEVQCQEMGPNDPPVSGESQFYLWGTDGKARYGMVDVLRSVRIFGMQIEIISSKSLRDQFYPPSIQHNSDSATQAAPSSSSAADSFSKPYLRDAGRQR
ncbi:MAG: hypothetical protein EYC62_06920 [Alphaproteobacteria bacterium]|nr:MAG: hypothetical protein EYC62_06920 [Alphaproteobacteria bacterium]